MRHADSVLQAASAEGPASAAVSALETEWLLPGDQNQKPAYDSIVLKNDSPFPVFVALAYLAWNGELVVAGWWRVEPGLELLTDVRSTGQSFWYYAQTTGDPPYWIWTDRTERADTFNVTGSSFVVRGQRALIGPSSFRVGFREVRLSNEWARHTVHLTYGE